jgi:hypothetical protein
MAEIAVLPKHDPHTEVSDPGTPRSGMSEENLVLPSYIEET